MEESSLVKSKAKCLCLLLQELNDIVKAKLVGEDLEEVSIETNISFFSPSAIVMATQLMENFMISWMQIALLV